MNLKSNLSNLVALTLLCGVVVQTAVAKQGATDPIPGTSKGAVKSGGGGKSSTPSPTPAPAPAPAPAPTPVPTVTPLAVGPITFTPAGPINGVLPVCAGNFIIDPYYPTLLDMTVNVSVSSMSVPDGTILYVNVVGTGGTLYPYTSNAITIIGGSGICSEKVFITVGAGLAGVVISDAFGNPVFAGN